jgi:hypothetical protein
MKQLATSFHWLRGSSDEAAGYRTRVSAKIKACYYRKRASTSQAKKRRLAEQAENKRARREKKRAKKKAKKNAKPRAEDAGEVDAE